MSWLKDGDGVGNLPMKALRNRFASSFLITLFLASAIHAESEDRLRVMTFNLWHGGEAGGQPLAQTINAIKSAKADIIGLQETHGREVNGVRPDNGQKIADQLGWHYLQQGDRTAILSRHRIIKPSQNRWGVEIEYPRGKQLDFFNAHFAASPYQPYQLLKIPYGDGKFIATESEAVQEANAARGAAVGRLLYEIKNAIQSGHPVVLTGDFNEPSHQDWTARAAQERCCPLKVCFPTTSRIASAGLIDAWRTHHKDEVAFRGVTWTPTTSADDPTDKHDRIDFIFVSDSAVKVKSCQIVGEHKSTADLVVTPWPSDHRAVVAELSIH